MTDSTDDMEDFAALYEMHMEEREREREEKIKMIEFQSLIRKIVKEEIKLFFKRVRRI